MEATGNVGALSVAGDVVAASVALAGLILVYLGTISTAFDSYQKKEQVTVLGKYRRRAWFAVLSFALSISAAALALIGKWVGIKCAALAAIIILLFALILVLVAAVLIALDIK
jgi:hypothetical protein